MGMKNERPLRAAVRALHAAAVAGQAAETVGGDLESVGRLLDEVPGLEAALRDAGMRSDARRRLIDALFRGRVHRLAYDFIVRLERLGLLPHLRRADHLYRRRDKLHRRVREVEVVSAIALPPEDAEALRRRVGGGDAAVVFRFREDASLLAGFTVREGDRMTDCSAANRLARFRREMIR